MEDGEEVPLEKQGSGTKRIRMDIQNPDRKEYTVWIDQQMTEIVRGCGNDAFVKLKEVDPFTQFGSDRTFVFFYNLYKSRNGD